MTMKSDPYFKMTMEELQTLRVKIEGDPKNQNPGNLAGRYIWIFTDNARKRLDRIAWAITALLAKKRADAGNPVVCSGYSGRKSNRR